MGTYKLCDLSNTLKEFQHVMAENADLQCSIQMKETELSKVQEQLRDKVAIHKEDRIFTFIARCYFWAFLQEEKLTTVLGALTRAATTIRRGQEQIQDMMQHVSCVYMCIVS